MAADVAPAEPPGASKPGPQHSHAVRTLAAASPAAPAPEAPPSATPRPSPHEPLHPSQAAPHPQSSPPSPSRHTKTHHHCTTPDGWRLHLVHTRAVLTPAPPPPSPLQPPQAPPAGAGAAAAGPPPRRCPVVLCPGLGSSGAYTFDLSPVVSLADYLASRGWDVWTVELRGNGQSDRPRLFVRSRWWTIDDYVTKDLPAVLSYVRQTSGCAQAHVIGHSMGGMILTRLLALGGEPAAAVASATVVGSGCFLQGSWWQALEHTLWLARFLWLVPAGATLRAYSPLALGRAGLAAVDQLYFWPPNTDPVLARAVLARNFSAISSGVILQIGTAFGRRGLCTADGREAYADARRLAAVRTPVMFVCGDRDRMCPPQGAAATCALFTGSACARYVELGPHSPTRPTRHHYGHFDILMGRHAETEVFPLLASWLEEHDGGAAAAAAAGVRSVVVDGDVARKAAAAAGHAAPYGDGARREAAAAAASTPAAAPLGAAAEVPSTERQRGAAAQPSAVSAERSACAGGAAAGVAQQASPAERPLSPGPVAEAAAAAAAGLQASRISDRRGGDDRVDGGGGGHGGGGAATGDTEALARNPLRAYERRPPVQVAPFQAQPGFAPWAVEPAVMMRSRL